MTLRGGRAGYRRIRYPPSCAGRVRLGIGASRGPESGAPASTLEVGASGDAPHPATRVVIAAIRIRGRYERGALIDGAEGRSPGSPPRPVAEHRSPRCSPRRAPLSGERARTDLARGRCLVTGRGPGLLAFTTPSRTGRAPARRSPWCPPAPRCPSSVALGNPATRRSPAPRRPSLHGGRAGPSPRRLRPAIAAPPSSQSRTARSDGPRSWRTGAGPWGGPSSTPRSGTPSPATLAERNASRPSTSSASVGGTTCSYCRLTHSW